MSDYNIDDDDVSTLALVANPTTIPGLIVWIVVIAILWWAAQDNNADCAKHHCDTGKPVIVEHNCVCLQGAQ